MIKSWNELPVGKFQEIAEFCNAETTDELEIFEQNEHIISILTGKGIDELEAMPLAEFSKMASSVAFLNEPMPESKIDLTDFSINGKEYYCFSDIQNMLTGHYIDFQQTAKKADTDLALVLSTFIIPKGKKYNEGYDITKVQEEIREHLSIVDANGIRSFFISVLSNLIDNMLTSCATDRTLSREKREQMKKLVERARVNLQRIGDGMQM